MKSRPSDHAPEKREKLVAHLHANAGYCYRALALLGEANVVYPKRMLQELLRDVSTVSIFSEGGAIWYQSNRGHGVFVLPDEVVDEEPLVEGAGKQVTVNSYERNPVARQMCIDHYGTTCVVCGFDFHETYGDIGEGYTHVHHLRDLATIAKEYEVDPIEDLRPVCPNCHAMLHQGEGRSVKELRAIVENRRR